MIRVIGSCRFPFSSDCKSYFTGRVNKNKRIDELFSCDTDHHEIEVSSSKGGERTHQDNRGTWRRRTSTKRRGTTQKIPRRTKIKRHVNTQNTKIYRQVLWSDVWTQQRTKFSNTRCRMLSEGMYTKLRRRRQWRRTQWESIRNVLWQLSQRGSRKGTKGGIRTSRTVRDGQQQNRCNDSGGRTDGHFLTYDDCYRRTPTEHQIEPLHTWKGVIELR